MIEVLGVIIMRLFKLFVSSIVAGMCIAIGGTVYLSCVANGNGDMIVKVIGAFLFATGLFTICTYGFSLFTGKVGYLVDNKPAYTLDLLIIFLGNLVGTVGFAYLILGTRMADPLVNYMEVTNMVTSKLNDTWYSLLLLAIPCGFLMHFGVYTFKKLEKHAVARYISVFLGVALFIICGFEHVIANLFYITLAQKWSVDCIIPILMMIIGNALGGFIIPLYLKFNEPKTK